METYRETPETTRRETRTAPAATESSEVARSTYRTPSGIVVDARRERLGSARKGASVIAAIAESLDTRLGCVLTSGFEFPGHYTRWDVGFVDPSLVLEASGPKVTLRAANARGLALLPTLARVIAGSSAVLGHTLYCDRVVATLATRERGLAEEERLRGPSVISVLRALREAMAIDPGRPPSDPPGELAGSETRPGEARDPEPEPIGFYGAFGDDLVFGIEELAARLARDPEARDLVLFFADDVVVVDHARDETTRHTYELTIGSVGTHGLPREPLEAPGDSAATNAPRTPARPRMPREPDAARFRAGVERAREAFAASILTPVPIAMRILANVLADASARSAG